MTIAPNKIYYPYQVLELFEVIEKDKGNYGKIKPDTFISAYLADSFKPHSMAFNYPGYKGEIYRVSVKDENPPEFLTFIREKLNKPYFKWEEKTEHIGGPSCHDYDYTVRAFYFIFTPQKD